MSRYSSDPYSDKMRQYQNEYNGLILKAKEYRRAYGGPSVDEGNCYKSAAVVCQQIADLQDSQAARSQWLQHARNAEEQMVAVVRALDPQFAKQQAPSIGSMNSGTEMSHSSQPVQPAAQPVPNQGKDGQTKTVTIPSTDPNDSRPYTTTPTGFVTRNATRSSKITAETIERWYMRKPDHDFSDVTGMEGLKKDMITILTRINMTETCEEMGIDPFSCYLLYGPPGTGKTFLIEAFAAELMKRGFKFIQLAGADIHQDLVGVSEKVIEIAFLEAIDNAPCAIYIDEFEGVSVPRDGNAQSHEKRLTIALIEEYNKLKNSHKPIILLAASNHPNNIDVAWIDRMKKRLLLPLPNEETRRIYFEKKFFKYQLTGGLDFDYMVDSTDNFSFRDLDSIVDEVMDQILIKMADVNAVLDENGEINYKETDKLSKEMIQRGECDISKELFDTALRLHPPTPKEDILAELEEYEKKVQRGGN